MKKSVLMLLVGVFIIVISLFVVSGFMMDTRQGVMNLSFQSGTTSGEIANRWLVSGILPSLAILLLVFPVGIFYLRKSIEKSVVTKMQNIALWLHFSSTIILLIGSIPFLGCLTRISCGGEGIGEAIVFGLAAIPAGIIFSIGLLFLVLNRFFSNQSRVGLFNNRIGG